MGRVGLGKVILGMFLSLVAGAVIVLTLASSIPSISIKNNSGEDVRVNILWNDNKESLGLLESSKQADFNIRDDVAVTITAEFLDGKILKSEEMFHFSGVSIIFEIYNETIGASFDSST